ncbi:putative pectinesterase [Helianthus anomalus]
MIEPLIARVPNSGNKKKLFFTVFASILVIAAVFGIVVGINSKTTQTQSTTTSNNIRAFAAHAIVKSSCSVTLHPDLCYSTLMGIPNLTEKVKTSKDVIELTLYKTKERVQRNHFVVKKLTTMTNLTKSGKMALRVCLEMVANTLEELEEVVGFLKTYPTEKGHRGHVDDMITYMSTTITNQVKICVIPHTTRLTLGDSLATCR